MKQLFTDLGDKVLIKVDYLKPGVVLNCTTYDDKGNIVHPAYTAFSAEDIADLRNQQINEIFYSRVKAEKQQPLFENNLQAYLSRNVYKGPRTIKTETQQKAVHLSEEISRAVRNHSEIDFEAAQQVIGDILTDLQKSKEEIINLIDIQSFDDFTHSHCLNVGVIAMTFAQKLGMEDTLIKDIGVAGFLHDLGKIRLPYALIHKKGSFNTNEFNIMKKHPRYSYEIVKKSHELNENIKKTILLHHEKYDGSGYPFGFRGDQLEDAVYIVAIAEFYDALTTKLSYKEALTSTEALKYVIKNAGRHFKPELAHRFAKTLGKMFFKESDFYEIGSYVLLNTEEIAKVVNKENEVSTRPGIEIIRSASGKMFPKPIYIDLKLDSRRKIAQVLNNMHN